MPGHAHGGVITHTRVHPRRVGKYRTGHVALLGVVAGPAAGARSGPGAAGRGPLAGRRALRARLRTKKRYVIETSRYYMPTAVPGRRLPVPVQRPQPASCMLKRLARRVTAKGKRRRTLLLYVRETKEECRCTEMCSGPLSAGSRARRRARAAQIEAQGSGHTCHVGTPRAFLPSFPPSPPTSHIFWQA